MRTSLWGLGQFLKSKNIDFLDGNGGFKEHWVYDEGCSRTRLKVVKSIFAYLGQSLQDSKYISIRKKKTCKVEKCVCPDCYTFIKKGNVTKGNGCRLGEQDLEELCEEINVDRCEEIGLDKYLDEFNEQQPSFLKIGMEELKAAIFYLKKIERKKEW